jgi:Putative zinc-finger
MNCPNPNSLRAYYDGEIDAANRPEIELHLANCPECRARLREMEVAANRVHGQLAVLDESPSAAADLNPQIALARLKAQHGLGEQQASLPAGLFARAWRPAWVLGFAILLLGLSLAFPSGRSLAQKFLATLRVERIQPVRIDFSSLDSNRTLQQMLGQMISEKMVVTTDEKPQHPASADAASQLAGFPVHLLTARVDTPQFTVEGQHAFQMTIDRERLQEIFDQAGRPDLLLPAKLDGATVSVQVPRSVHLQYGECFNRRGPGQAALPQSAGTPNCLVFIQAPSPTVNVPADLNIQQLAEIALQLGGMDPTKAQELCKTIDWRSTLVLPIPRFVDSYTVVDINGAQGTLVSHTDRRGSEYVLIWVKGGIIYALTGHGDSSEALRLADSLE